VKFIVLSRSIPDADRTAVQAAEKERIEELGRGGFFDQIYLRADGQGAVSVVEAESEEAVRQVLSELPLFVAGCIAIDDVLEVLPRW